MSKQKKIKNPLGRSIIIWCIIIIALFSTAIGIVSYITFNNQMMEHYRGHITEVLNFAMSNLDVEDLKECIETKQKSEKFEEFSAVLDNTRQSSSIESLNILLPIKNGDRYEIMEVMSALYPDERAGEGRKDVPIPELGDMITDNLPEGFPESVYNLYINSHDIEYSQADNVYGKTYDATYTIRDKEDNPVALLVASISIEEIDNTMTTYVIIIVMAGMLLSVLFVFVMSYWLRKRIIKPLKELGDAADTFEEMSHGANNPDILVLGRKLFHSGDEIEALEDTLIAMSENVKSYVEKLVRSAIEVEGMKQEVTRANDLAMRDALTGVKNKAAYDQQRNRLDLDIKAGDAEFAIIMVDLNHLKRINDTYGHEKGNIYIKKMCTMICDTFSHSPVFRVGGDEFIIVLIHRDYENRDDLVSKIKTQMTELAARDDLDEWVKPTAAMGIGVYSKHSDDCSDAVLKRADAAMYANKKEMKAGRE